MEPLVVLYRVACEASRIEARADALAREQTTELPAGAAAPDAEARVVGVVASVAPDGEGAFLVEIEVPAATQDGGGAQLLNVLFGNASLQDDVTLVDARLPPWLAAGFPGPRRGVAGVRALTGARGRALTCTALKPQGLSVPELARLCATFARAGVDVVKDDHGLADQPSAPFAERVHACQEAAASAARDGGGSCVYAPNLCGTPDDVLRQAERAREAGARAVMLAPMLLGAPLLEQLARADTGLALLAHPALAGAARIEPALLLGRLFRLLGADAVVFPHHGGRFPAFDAARCRAVAARLRDDEHGLAPALPVPAGGVDAARAAEAVAFYGPDVMLLVGGSLYAGGPGLEGRARRFVDAVRGAGRG